MKKKVFISAPETSHLLQYDILPNMQRSVAAVSVLWFMLYGSYIICITCFQDQCQSYILKISGKINHGMMQAQAVSIVDTNYWE